MRQPIKQLPAIALSVITFMFLSVIGVYWAHMSNNATQAEQKFLLGGIARAQASIVERRLALAFTSAQMLAHDIEKSNGDSRNFQSYAKDIRATIGGIHSLQLAPDGIIREIYPLAGNETALGLDIIKHPTLKEETLKAIQNKEMLIIGPIQLVQGGEAIISRSPIYLANNSNEERFWGFSSAVIMSDSLFRSTNLQELENQGYSYQLARGHLDSNNSTIFFSSELPLSETYASTDLILPAGNWSLSIGRDMSALLMDRLRFGYSLTLLIASLAAFSVYFVTSQPLKLRKLVNEKTQALQDLAYKDPLTGLYNRRHLTDTLPKLLLNNQAKQNTSAFIYFDLDDFKRINDTIGHDVGDQVLEIVAQRLVRIVKEEDTVVRLGGDEFGIYLSNVLNPHEAEEVARQVLDAIRSPLKIDIRDFYLTTSLGIAMIPEHGNDLVTIMQNADMALYESKLKGKNQCSFYDEKMKEQAINLAQVESDISHALQHQEFELYFQPIFDLSSKKIIGAEALIRWNHPEKGLVFPDKFITLAEDTGQIVDIGYWVIESAIQYLARRHQEGHPDILLHVNLSPLQLADPNLLDQVTFLLGKYQVNSSNLGFEVTETALLSDTKLAISLLNAFKAMGIYIAIDDFGIGYSSLGQLKNLPVNQLKIDRSFVMDLETDLDDRKIVEAIIAMSHKLGIKVIAEGIETMEQWQMLSDFHCDFGQGYVVSRPIPEAEFNARPQLDIV